MILLNVGVTLMSATGAAGRPYSETPELGGDGVGEFKSYCPPGELLVGLTGRVGDYVDAIQPVCRKRGSNTTHPNGPDRGGSGGSATSLICPSDTYITGWQIARSEGGRESKVRWIRPRCEGTLTYHAEPAVTPGQFGNGGDVGANDMMRYACDDGQFAVGILGASGSYVDRLGLMCEEVDGPLGPPSLPGKSLGRVPSSAPTGPPRSICEAAADARARNSPAAPNLEANCRAYLERQKLQPAPPVVITPQPPHPGAQYNSPMIVAANGQTVMLDYCRDYGEACGMPAADAYCVLKGHPGASRFQISEDIGHTAIISTGAICDDPTCDGFSKIQCKPD